MSCFAPTSCSMMGYDEAVGYLSKNMGSSIKSYINTPQKLNMFIDVVGKGFSAINHITKMQKRIMRRLYIIIPSEVLTR